MKSINASDYFDLVMKGFDKAKQKYETEEMTIIAEDIFRIVWMTSVKFNSFITFADEIDIYSFQNYVRRCLETTKQNRSRLGFPSVCNAVLITRNAPEKVIEYALKRPAMHTSMTEYSIVVDLATGKTHYYTGPILYGIIYAKFEREYIDGHFALPLRYLKDKKGNKGKK